MTKKNLAYFTISLLLTCCIIIPIKAETRTSGRLINLDVSAVAYNGLEGLEDKAAFIIKAIVLPNQENVYFKEENEIFSIRGRTRTNIQITEVFKGNVKVDDIITIEEPYFKLTLPKDFSLDGRTISDGGEYTLAYSNYSPAIVGEEYLFFLHANYQVLGLDLGKYIIRDKEETENIESDISLLSGYSRERNFTENKEAIEKVNKFLDISNSNDLYYIEDYYPDVKAKYNLTK